MQWSRYTTVNCRCHCQNSYADRAAVSPGLEGLIALELMKTEALYSPERLIDMIRAGDPAMRLSLRAELRRVISRIDLDFAIDPEGLTSRFALSTTRRERLHFLS
jgi:hypothetical protein